MMTDMANQMYTQMDWAVATFRSRVDQKQDRDGNSLATHLEAAKANLGLLYYVTRIYPKGRFPAYERAELEVTVEEEGKTYRDLAEEAGFRF